MVLIELCHHRRIALAWGMRVHDGDGEQYGITHQWFHIEFTPRLWHEQHGVAAVVEQFALLPDVQVVGGVHSALARDNHFDLDVGVKYLGRHLTFEEMFIKAIVNRLRIKRQRLQIQLE